MVGKYLDIGDYQLRDSYISVNEALKHACAKHNVKLNLTWIDSKILKSYDRIIQTRCKRSFCGNF